MGIGAANRSTPHPDVERGEFHSPPAVSDQLAICLSDKEQHAFRAGKVIYNCLLADLYPPDQRPWKADLDHGWPADVRQRVIDNWHA